MDGLMRMGDMEADAVPEVALAPQGMEGALGDSLEEAFAGVTIGSDRYEPLADGEYDAVVLGTGLTECIMSGLLSVSGLKVLNVDRNQYYGGLSASLNLKQLFEKFKGVQVDPPESVFGKSRDYNVDLVPKFIMASGNMVNMLIYCDVAKYLDFKLVDGSFVFSGSRPHKVPVTPSEAMTSGLMGLLEKNRCRQFFSWVHFYDLEDESTWQKRDIRKVTMGEIYKYFGLQKDTIEFIGHSLALWRDESYIEQPALETVQKIKHYADSLARYGKSPYLYPLYGLGELPQSFARLSAVHGGTFMLGAAIDSVLYDSEGKACGVRAGNQAAKCKFVVGDHSYFPDKVQKKGKVVRCYCVLSSPPANTRDSNSCQIIIPARQTKTNRKSDIYVLVLSSAHKVAPEGKYIALVSTTVETDDPASELKPGLDLLGPIIDSFLAVDDMYEPASSGQADQCFITRSYDATTHFETAVDDVCDVYQRIFGKALDLSAPKPGSR
ncbi:Rab GDP dissociation inhibitor alpha [Porphyridium purpureum]|uniref:Rab GDP dissociation inhibitor n=1 Tax=Porphyridium purpureum TaxID=35688 RepID=A0A5J4Z3Q2_PORPP|nr:Rab GDP dissociation inhibitor alpha [Porphyridium purpureum]|eukprot:POR8380..scf295_1